MWWVGSEPVDVYLGLADGGFAVGGQPVAWAAHGDAAQWFAEARKHLRSRWRKPRVRVWLSGALARPFVWGPVQGLASWQEVELAAQNAAPDATGLAGPCVVSVDEWPASPVLVVAVEANTCAGIIDGARRAGVHVQSIRPWWAGALDRRLLAEPSTPVFAASDTDALTVLTTSDDGWQAAHSVLPLPGAGQAEPLLDRLLLGVDLERSAMRHARLVREASTGAWPREEAVA